MINNLPIFITLVFGLTTITTLYLFYKAVKNSTLEATQKKANKIIVGLSIWLIIQAFLTLKNWYNLDSISMPPKILVYGILPTIFTIILLFVTHAGRLFIYSLPLVNLTYLNIVRIPVEFVLYCLYLYKAVPQLMTFEGRNFDIIAGVTAPFIAYFGFVKAKLPQQIILVWNLICLCLLANIVISALLSAPTAFQKFAFAQPNIAMVNFPFSWLPTFIVPIVLFGHLVSIRRLIKS